MFVRHAKLSVFCLFLIISVYAVIAVAQDPAPQRLQNDDAEDAELDCFECSRGDLLTFDSATGEVTRQKAPAAVSDLMQLITEGRQGALVPLDDEEALKDFGALHDILDATVGDYPKHVKLFSAYTNEYGHEVRTECSGTMIDPFHVLTAGHCVYKFEDEDGYTVDDWAHTIRVVPAYDEGAEPFGRAYNVQLHSYAGWTENADWDWDIAVIDLEWPIGALSGWRGYGTSSICDWFTGGLWIHYGYPGEDNPHDGETMWWQSGFYDGCETSGNEVWFDREMFKGQSGGGAVKNDILYALRSNSIWVGVDDWDTYDVRITSLMFADITGWINDDIPGTPDLMPLTIDMPNPPTLGEYFTFSFLLHNYSSATANGSWPVDVFISVDDTIDAGDQLIGSVVISGTVGAMSTVEKTIGFPIPCETPRLTSYLGIHVHAADANSANDWTRPLHVVNGFVHTQLPPPVPSPYSPPDMTLCCDRFDLPLLWSDSGPDCSYEVQIGTSPGTGPVYSTENNYYTVTNLLGGHWYYWRVRARPECVWDWSDWSDDSRFFTEPDPNEITTVVSPPDSAHCVYPPATLQWTPLGGAETYDVRISSNWCYEGDIIAGIQYTEVTIPELDPNTTYYWAVRANTTCGQTTTWSSAQQFCFTFKTAPVGGIDAPTLIVPLDGSICESPETGLLWNHAEDWAHYEVQIGTACETGPVYVTTSNSLSTTGLESEVTYYWRVRTFHECGHISEWTPCRSFSLDLDPPQNPTTVGSNSHTVGVWSQDITVDTWWDFGSDSCTNAMVDYGFLFDNSPDTEPIEVTSEMPEFTYTTSDDLADADDIWFHLRSSDQAGNWALETMHLGPFWIDATDPSEIQITSVNLPANLWGDYGELTVTWNPATDATSGVAGYSYLLDVESGTGPDGVVDSALETATLPLPYGSRFFRIAAVDAASNMGRVAEAGPFLNDASLPAFLVPEAGQEVAEGQLLQVQWELVSRVNSGALNLSLDGGQTFTQIAVLSGQEVESGLFSWVVPAETTEEAVLMLDVDAVAGPFSAASALFSLRAVTGVGDRAPAVAGPTLVKNYPNPFNPVTTIAYTLPAETRARVMVFDARGHHIRTLVDWQEHGPGRHEVEWDGTNTQGLRVSSGVYFSCLETPRGRDMKRMALVK